ncbi:MAG TPA: metal ABC transporter substrate-binding protein [Pseudolabrys sp.]|nr:metal ABC transporter substrate-binding protein [Pseudolabrys sp.]
MLRVFLCALVLTLGLAPASAQQPKLKVVATFSILADLARNVGGDRIEVTSLVGPNGDAHVYAPSPADARTLAAAQLIVENGLGFEGFMERLVKASGTKAPVVVASKGVRPLHDGNEIDPHAWQSVANAKLYVVNIRDALKQVDPAGASVYDAQTRGYLAKLDALEGEVKATIAAIPPERRKIITTHDAFGYFAAAYGLKFIAPEGVATDSEASAKAIAAIITQVRVEKVPAIFLENIIDPRLMKIIAHETGARIGGTLFSDALSAANGPASTYIDMMQNNIRQFSAALASS